MPGGMGGQGEGHGTGLGQKRQGPVWRMVSTFYQFFLVFRRPRHVDAMLPVCEKMPLFFGFR